MATLLRVNWSFHARLFALFLCASWILTAFFIAFQYHREKQFKAEKLNEQLQLINEQLLHSLEDGDSDFTAVYRPGPFSSLRITIINLKGNVLFDNSVDARSEENHLDRVEVQKALKEGQGYAIARLSESNNTRYFYSATRRGEIVLRTAIPYSLSLQNVLKADRSFLVFMGVFSLFFSLLSFLFTRPLGKTIQRLNLFAERVERGERIYTEEDFPHDELGSIAEHIIRLYARLQQTIARVEKEHQLALHQEREKIRIKKQLTNNINHELKTPLSSISVCIETLLAHPEIPKEQYRLFLERCAQSCTRLNALLEDVSILTRIEDGNRQILRKKLLLGEIVDDAIKEVSIREDAKAFSIRQSLPQTMQIDGNDTLLGSLFRNLLNNAISYSEGDEIVINCIKEDEQRYTLSFSDNGKGIEEKFLPHIFERFFRCDYGRSRKTGGTGLGLAIVKNVVILHGGTITAQNKTPHGLEFIFSLEK